MNRIIYNAKRVFPSPLWKLVTGPYWWWYNRARHQLAAVYDARLRESRARLEEFRNLHIGERCFILGNGPSLSRMNLSPLKDELTFGLNRIYLLFPHMGFSTSYYVSVNTLVIEQCAEEIGMLDMPKFITWRGRKQFRSGKNLYFLDTDYTGDGSFSQDITGRVFEGSTVTFVALQIAYFMGFHEVILIGIDHRFSAKGPPNATVISEGYDRDHFSAQYFGKGFQWQLPDLEASERAYGLAQKAFEADGRRVLDATDDGNLSVYPKVDYRSLFQ